MAESLLLDSLEIKNFRAFRRLRIEKLGRVNLIVGRNSVGKTSLLDAVSLYAYDGQLQVIEEQLKRRDEMPELEQGNRKSDNSNRRLLAMRHLFSGRNDAFSQNEPITIGVIGDHSQRVSIAAGWYTVDTNSAGEQQARPLKPEEYNGLKQRIPMLVTQYGINPPSYFRLEGAGYSLKFWLNLITCQSVSSNGLSNADITTLWDKVSLTTQEDEVVKTLQIVKPQVERINLISSADDEERIPMAKIAGQSNPVPLRSLGEGMSRLFGIALSLANAKEGFLLIDEIENGLHYSTQLALWRLIFTAAQQQNVQVFATTHSLDCIRAFQRASHAHADQGMLISLRARQDDPSEIVSVPYDEERLEIATQEQIEVR